MLKIIKRVFKHTEIIEYIVMYIGLTAMLGSIIYNVLFNM